MKRNRVCLDEAELCVRMLEAATGEKRPAGRSLVELLETVEGELLEQTLAKARAALLYFTETIQFDDPPQTIH